MQIFTIFSFLCYFLEVNIGVYASHNGNTAKKECTTNEGEEGQCVLISECPSLQNLLKFRRIPHHYHETLTLENRKCGYEGIHAKVCCPLTITSMYPENSTEEGPFESIYLPNTDICGAFSAEYIIGGENAALGEFPWMSLLEYETPYGRKFLCGGSLINNRYVLTAAHCVHAEDLSDGRKLINVRLGEYKISSATDCHSTKGYCADSPINVSINETIIHQEYIGRSTTKYHDIALIRLAEEILFTDFIKPICIPTTVEVLNTTNYYIGNNMTVAGWGATENSIASDILLKVRVPVKPNSECSQMFPEKVTSFQLCAGGETEKDSCKGDSGGPLMTTYLGNFFIAGIVSYGSTPCGLQYWPGVYTKVSEYVPWIIDNLRA